MIATTEWGEKVHYTIPASSKALWTGNDNVSSRANTDVGATLFPSVNWYACAASRNLIQCLGENREAPVAGRRLSMKGTRQPSAISVAARAFSASRDCVPRAGPPHCYFTSHMG
jgi:hypothetical protein